MPNPCHRRIDVRGVDAGLQVGQQRHQHRQPQQHWSAAFQQRLDGTVAEIVVQLAPVELGVASLRLRRQFHPQMLTLAVPVGADEGQHFQCSARQMLDHGLRRFLRERQQTGGRDGRALARGPVFQRLAQGVAPLKHTPRLHQLPAAQLAAFVGVLQRSLHRFLIACSCDGDGNVERNPSGLHGCQQAFFTPER